MEPRHVLVVDDSDPIGEAIRRILGRQYRVEFAPSGGEAVTKATTRAFELILLDFHLPDIQGDVVLERLRRLGVTTPVILMSGSKEAEAAASAVGVAYLAKPFTLSSLAQMVESVVLASQAART